MDIFDLPALVEQSFNSNGNNMYNAVVSIADQHGYPAHQVAAIMPSRMDPNLSMLDQLPNIWPRMRREILDSEQTSMMANVIQKDLLIGKMAKSVADMALFPENTIFTHALGVVASAMCPKFTYSVKSNYLYTEGNAITLYVCSAQPAGSAKSWVNNVLTRPLRGAYKTINEKRALAKIQIQHEINEIEEGLKKDKGGAAMERKELRLLQLKEDLLGLGKISPAITDATPEALEIAAIEHGGFVNVISAEAESITVAIGGLYNEGKSNNMGLVLSMWDGDEEITIKRASRAAFSGKVKGCFVTISQDEGIRALLEAGRSGRGISERFLIMREPEMLGYRNLKDKKPLNEKVAAAYNGMIENLVLADDTELEFNHEAHDAILDYLQELEPKMKADGEFSDNMLRGVIGKAEKQIFRLACIYHASQEWAHNGSKNRVVSFPAIAKAIHTFDQFKNVYVGATESRGMAGETARLNQIIDAFDQVKNQAKRRRNKLTLSEFTSTSRITKKGTPIGDRNDRADVIKASLPILIDAGFCAYDGRTITINPNL